MKIAVTGASGHVGINLIPKLIENNYEVSVLAHKNAAILEHFNVNLIRGDLMDRGSLVEFVDEADVVIHLAAVVTIQEKSPEALRVNVEGTRNLLNIARERKVKKFIHFSSIHSLNVFPLEETLDETRELNFTSPFDYDLSKVKSEQMVVEASSHDLATVILNSTSILGPRDYQPSLIGQAIIQFYKGRIPAILNGGYNWVDVRDVVDATLKAIDKAPPGSKFMLSGHWRNLKQLGTLIAENGGAPCPRFTVPFWLARFGARFLNYFSTGKTGDQLFTVASLETLQHSHRDISNKKARAVLGFNPRPFDKTLADTIDWFRDQKLIS